MDNNNYFLALETILWLIRISFLYIPPRCIERSILFVKLDSLCDQEFPIVSKLDTGSYFCEASNGEGTPQRGDAVRMEVRK